MRFPVACELSFLAHVPGRRVMLGACSQERHVTRSKNCFFTIPAIQQRQVRQLQALTAILDCGLAGSPQPKRSAVPSLASRKPLPQSPRLKRPLTPHQRFLLHGPRHAPSCYGCRLIGPCTCDRAEADAKHVQLLLLLVLLL